MKKCNNMTHIQFNSWCKLFANITITYVFIV